MLPAGASEVGIRMSGNRPRVYMLGIGNHGSYSTNGEL